MYQTIVDVPAATRPRKQSYEPLSTFLENILCGASPLKTLLSKHKWERPPFTSGGLTNRSWHLRHSLRGCRKASLRRTQVLRSEIFCINSAVLSLFMGVRWESYFGSS